MLKKTKNNTALATAVLIAVAINCRAQSSRHDERGLWKIWVAGANSAFMAPDVARDCQQFKTENPTDSLAVVAAGIEAWNYLKAGKTEAAVEVFNSMLLEKGRGKGLQKAGDRMARSWLSRLDREKVAAGLKKLYLRNIEFPASLDSLQSLKNMPVPPLTDRWGKPWEYSRKSTIKGMASQRYKLESSVLGSRSVLEKALKVSYGKEIDLRPVRVLPNVRDTIEFKTASGRVVLRRVEDGVNRINLDYLGEYIIVLSDGSHWSVMAKPR
ncbi:MAG: hypothetical protein R6V06_09805 [Kiritimatiellia bacterium]